MMDCDDDISDIDRDLSKVATITCHTTLHERIDKSIVAELLPVHWDELSPNFSESSIPHPGKEGVILFLRYQSIVRGSYGFLRQTDLFKNSIGLDISVDTKMINTKFSDATVHMCGVKSQKNIQDVMRLLNDKILIIKEFFEAMNEGVDIWGHIKWYLKRASGADMSRKIICDDKNNTVISMYDRYINPVPIDKEEPNFDIRVYRFLDSYSEEKIYYSHLHSRLYRIYDFVQDKIFSMFCKVLGYTCKISMQNYNYYLGFRISKVRVAEFIISLSNTSLRADYHPDMSKNSLKILVWLPNGLRYDFTLYVCGNVMQSGRHTHHVDAYNLLIPLLRLHRERIEFIERGFERKKKAADNRLQLYKRLLSDNIQL